MSYSGNIYTYGIILQTSNSTQLLNGSAWHGKVSLISTSSGVTKKVGFKQLHSEPNAADIAAPGLEEGVIDEMHEISQTSSHFYLKDY